MHWNVFGLRVKVEFKSILETQGLLGYFDPNKLLVVIDNTVSKSEQMKTMIHELFHILSERNGWKQVLSQQAEELLCEHITYALLENFDFRLKSQNAQSRGGAKKCQKKDSSARIRKLKKSRI